MAYFSQALHRILYIIHSEIKVRYNDPSFFTDHQLMSLLKIPAVVLAASCLLLGSSNPNPHPNASERFDTAWDVRFLPQIIPLSLGKVSRVHFSRGLCSACAESNFHQFPACFWAFSEVAVILAHNYPDYPISTTILSNLVIAGDPANVRVTPAFTLGLLLALSFASLRMYCYRTMGRFFTFSLTLRKHHKLITRGPYQYVRHPSYTAGCLGVPAVWVLFATRGSWAWECGILGHWTKTYLALAFSQAALLIFVVHDRIPREDAMLRIEFKEEWEEWARRVPYVLIPGLI